MEKGLRMKQYQALKKRATQVMAAKQNQAKQLKIYAEKFRIQGQQLVQRNQIIERMK